MAKKTTTVPKKRYAALSTIGTHDDDGKFIRVMPGQLVELTDDEHWELYALGHVGETAIDAPAEPAAT